MKEDRNSLRWIEVEDPAEATDALWVVRVGNGKRLERLVLDRQLLPEREILHAQTIRHPLRRSSYIIARGALRASLAPLLETAPRDIVFETGEHGKPMVHGAFFNISHSCDWTLVAISSHCEIGVDIQEMREETPIERIAARFFTDTEHLAILEERDHRARRELFFRIWTRKEAYVKALGSGLFLERGEMDVPLMSDQFGGGASPAWRMLSFKPAKDYWAAVCAADSLRGLATYEWIPQTTARLSLHDGLKNRS